MTVIRSRATGPEAAAMNSDLWVGSNNQVFERKELRVHFSPKMCCENALEIIPRKEILIESGQEKLEVNTF